MEYYATLFLITFAISFTVCALIVNSNKLGYWFKKLFYVPCVKSSSGAVLLGGLSVLAGSFFVMIAMGLPKGEFISWAIPALILGGIGYLDDRIELKASIKLTLQVSAALTFCALISLTNDFSFPVFAILCVWALGVFNGSNLLDGIDTYSVKYSIITFSAFAVTGYHLGIEEVVIKSTCFIAPMLAFYYFNKYPSKLHLGEVGSTIMGLNCMFLSVCLFNCLSDKYPTQGLNTNSLLMALSLMHLPMTELGISFLRRLSKKKSPFKGDKLHLHYLLANIEKKGPSNAATMLAFFHLLGFVVNATLLHVFNPATAFLGAGAYYVSYYMYFGMKHWKESAVEANVSNVVTLSDYRESSNSIDDKDQEAA